MVSTRSRTTDGTQERYGRNGARGQGAGDESQETSGGYETSGTLPSPLGVLEMLAADTPAEHFETLAAQARRRGAGGQDLADLERGILLGRAVQARCAHRRQREAGLSALVGIAVELSAQTSLDSLLKVAVQRARLLLGTDLACVCLPGPGGGPAVARAAAGHVSAHTAGLVLPAPAETGPAGVTGMLPFQTADYLHDDRVPHDPVLDAAVEAEGVRAALVVPLGDDGPTGALFLADRSPRHFTQGEVSLVVWLSALVSTAVAKVTALERARAEASALGARSAESAERLRTAEDLADLRRRLVGRALDGAAPAVLAEAAASRLDGALRILAADGTVLDSTGGGADGDWDADGDGAAALAAHSAAGPVDLGGGLWAAPVRARGIALGTVLLRRDRPATAMDVTVLTMLAEAVAVLLLGDCAARAAAPVPPRDGFLDDLAAAPLPAGPHGAGPTGAEPGRPLVLVVARTRPDDLAKALTWGTLHVRRRGGLAGEHHGLLVLVLPGTDPSQAAHAIMDELAPLLDGTVTVAGAGPVPHQGAAPAAFEEARQCLAAMTVLGATGCAASERDLGFFGPLLSDSRDVTAFVHSAIGPVLDYDRQRSTELTRTLEAYFLTGGSPTYAAQRLFVHPNTVGRRLERIRELLGPDWHKPDRTLKVQLALRLHRLRQTLVERLPGPPDEFPGPPE